MAKNKKIGMYQNGGDVDTEDDRFAAITRAKGSPPSFEHVPFNFNPDYGNTIRNIQSVANPERFDEALKRFPRSSNIEDRRQAPDLDQSKSKGDIWRSKARDAYNYLFQPAPSDMALKLGAGALGRYQAGGSVVPGAGAPPAPAASPVVAPTMMHARGGSVLGIDPNARTPGEAARRALATVHRVIHHGHHLFGMTGPGRRFPSRSPFARGGGAPGFQAGGDVPEEFQDAPADMPALEPRLWRPTLDENDRPTTRAEYPRLSDYKGRVFLESGNRPVTPEGHTLLDDQGRWRSMSNMQAPTMIGTGATSAPGQDTAYEDALRRQIEGQEALQQAAAAKAAAAPRPKVAPGLSDEQPTIAGQPGQPQPPPVQRRSLDVSPRSERRITGEEGLLPLPGAEREPSVVPGEAEPAGLPTQASPEEQRGAYHWSGGTGADPNFMKIYMGPGSDAAAAIAKIAGMHGPAADTPESLAAGASGYQALRKNQMAMKALAKAALQAENPEHVAEFGNQAENAVPDGFRTTIKPLPNGKYQITRQDTVNGPDPVTGAYPTTTHVLNKHQLYHYFDSPISEIDHQTLHRDQIGRNIDKLASMNVPYMPGRTFGPNYRASEISPGRYVIGDPAQLTETQRRGADVREQFRGLPTVDPRSQAGMQRQKEISDAIFPQKQRPAIEPDHETAILQHYDRVVKQQAEGGPPPTDTLNAARDAILARHAQPRGAAAPAAPARGTGGPMGVPAAPAGGSAMAPNAAVKAMVDALRASGQDATIGPDEVSVVLRDKNGKTSRFAP